MMKRYDIKLICTLVCMLVIASCTPSKYVTIKTNPPGAQVYIDSENYGKAPVQDTRMYFPKYAPEKLVQVTLEGYEPSTIKITHQPTNTTQYTVELQKRDVVSIELIDFESFQTNQGVKLKKVKYNSLAYLDEIERSPTVKAVTKITRNEESTFQIGKPVMNPKNNTFIYQIYAEEEDEDGYCNIWVQNVGGVGKGKITSGQNFDLFPCYSNDGEFVYFSSNRISENSTIWKTRALGGGGITSITKTQAEDYAPCLTPDDKMVVYTSIPPNAEEPQIWMVNATGTLQTQLREGELPSVSPDGKKILYQRRDLNTTYTREDGIAFHPIQLWVMNIDGSGETLLTQNDDYNNIQAQWSPDGKRIVYASDQGKDGKDRNNWDIWMMNADGTGETQLTINGSWDDNPSWSYDGTRIYFRSNRGGYWNIWYFEPYLYD